MDLMNLLKNKELIFITGKGGVGKSTISAALSCAFAKSQPVLAIDVDPAHSLPDVLGTKVLHNHPYQPQESLENLTLILNTPNKIVEQVEEGKNQRLKNRAEGLPTYHSIMHLYSVMQQLGIPVAMEDFTSLNTTINERSQALKKDPNTKIICDLEPSNATLRLLKDAKYSVTRLKTMAKHKGKISLLARASNWPDIAHFVNNKKFISQVEKYAEAFEEFYKTIQNPKKTSFIIASSPEPVVLKETTRLKNELESLKLPVSAIIFNKDYSRINSGKLNGTILEHFPEQHKKNVLNYMRENTSYRKHYFSIPPLDIGIAKTSKQKIRNLEILANNIKPLN